MSCSKARSSVLSVGCDTSTNGGLGVCVCVCVLGGGGGLTLGHLALCQNCSKARSSQITLVIRL